MVNGDSLSIIGSFLDCSYIDCEASLTQYCIRSLWRWHPHPVVYRKYSEKYNY